MRDKPFITVAGYSAGIIFTLLSALRYFVVYYDLDRALVYILIGGFVCGFAWVYDKIKLKHEQDENRDADLFKVIGWIEEHDKKEAK